MQQKLSAESSTRGEQSEQHCRRQEGGTRFQIHLCAASLRETRLAGSGSSAGAISCSNHGKAPGPQRTKIGVILRQAAVCQALQRGLGAPREETQQSHSEGEKIRQELFHYSTAETQMLVERRENIIPWPLPAPPLRAPQPPLRPLPPRPRPHHRTELPSHPEAYLWKYQ